MKLDMSVGTGMRLLFQKERIGSKCEQFDATDDDRKDEAILVRSSVRELAALTFV